MNIVCQRFVGKYNPVNQLFLSCNLNDKFWRAENRLILAPHEF